MINSTSNVTNIMPILYKVVYIVLKLSYRKHKNKWDLLFSVPEYKGYT